jgi:hypothetical protein
MNHLWAVYLKGCSKRSAKQTSDINVKRDLTLSTSVGFAIALDRLPAKTAQAIFFILDSSPPTFQNKTC